MSALGMQLDTHPRLVAMISTAEYDDLLKTINKGLWAVVDRLQHNFVPLMTILLGSIPSLAASAAMKALLAASFAAAVAGNGLSTLTLRPLLSSTEHCVFNHCFASGQCGSLPGGSELGGWCGLSGGTGSGRPRPS